MNGPIPTPPSWAVAAGLPAPTRGETFRDYVTRLGLSPSELLEGLTTRTAVVANIRLASKVADTMPEAWQKHLRWFISQHSRTPPAGYSGNGTGTL
jgi:hypothetical protein